MPRKNYPALKFRLGRINGCLISLDYIVIMMRPPQGDLGPVLSNFLPIDIDFNTEEVILAINASKGRKAPGPDSIPVDLFKSCPLLWGPLLTLVLWACCTCGLPPTWTESILVPTFKKGDRNDPACYRPISLLDSLVKVAGRVILNRLQMWAENAGVISELQYGFRQGLGTVEQSLNLCLLLGKYTQAKKGSLYLCFVDLSSAFDGVNHQKLWSILEAMGVETPSINFFKQSYLDARGRVRYGRTGELSDNFPVRKGVRQR